MRTLKPGSDMRNRIIGDSSYRSCDLDGTLLSFVRRGDTASFQHYMSTMDDTLKLLEANGAGPKGDLQVLNDLATAPRSSCAIAADQAYDQSKLQTWYSDAVKSAPEHSRHVSLLKSLGEESYRQLLCAANAVATMLTLGRNRNWAGLQSVADHLASRYPSFEALKSEDSFDLQGGYDNLTSLQRFADDYANMNVSNIRASARELSRIADAIEQMQSARERYSASLPDVLETATGSNAHTNVAVSTAASFQPATS
jgi:hypothetical protein